MTTKQCSLSATDDSIGGRLPDAALAIVARVERAISDLDCLPEHYRIAALNRIREAVHRASPFEEPVDLVIWVPAGAVEANDYNPNAVASPEMKLLEHSIRTDGYTQPIVTAYDEDIGKYVVVDGFHRNRVGKEAADIHERLHGYLPVTVIDKDIKDRMASTIRHNRARGKHQVDLMGELVRELVQRGWGDAQIAEHLGMSFEELLRLKQLVGIARLFAAPDYSKSWGDVTEGDV
jgi:ParB-like chromosome segregation protein Spo0J